ncbi:MAG TPA: hypothetical protein VFY35_17355, partial [Burkholderiaceae bacterium]|nr:hypothetical protein [Burkholderiaceae bacterium]
FDLNHHLIPDPVGKAIACLLDRVAHLERGQGSHSLLHDHEPTPPGAAAACGTCDDSCAVPVFASASPPPTPTEETL